MFRLTLIFNIRLPLQFFKANLEVVFSVLLIFFIVTPLLSTRLLCIKNAVLPLGKTA